MELEALKTIVLGIVEEARRLKNRRTDQPTAPVNYACIFSQSLSEYEELLRVTEGVGTIIQDTKAGPVFKIPPVSTSAGELQLLKIRRPDPGRPERGDADFTVSDYASFKLKYLSEPGFGLIQRENFEMLELVDPGFNALAYFSHPPLTEQFGLAGS